MKNKIINTLLLILAGLFLFPNLFRTIWFDEALTIINIVQSKGMWQIYQNYVIPNNQIVYSILLHYWAKLNFLNISFDIYLRALNLIVSLLIISYFYWRFRSRLGNRVVTLMVISSLLLSESFQIYSTSVRGYQLSMLFLLIIVDLLYSLTVKFTRCKALGYLLLSMLILGVIPTNLLGLGMGVILIMPLLNYSKKGVKYLVILGLIPLIGLALFYLPIYSQFIEVCKLGEGVNERFNVFFITIASFVTSTLPLLIIAIIGFIKWLKKGSPNYKFLLRASLIFIPLIPCLILAKAPFYRVFYPVFIIWYIMLGYGVKHFYAYYIQKLPSNKQVRVIAIIFVMIFANYWIFHQNSVKQYISNSFVKAQDDLFSPYYMREDFQIRPLLDFIETNHTLAKHVYFTFESDPLANSFYLNFGNYSFAHKFQCNVGNQKLKVLYPQDLIVCKKGESASTKTKRITKIASFPYHDVYLVKEYLNDFTR